MYIQSRFTKDGSDWINNVGLFNRGLFVTYNLYDNLSWRKDFDNLLQINKINKRFIRRLEKKCNVHQKRRLERFVVTETDKPRNHCHLIIETPIHLSKEMMLTNVVKSLSETKGLGKIDIRNVRYKSGLIEYLCKELRPNKDSIDWENSYFRDNC
jgi:hypothetical protein